MVPWPPLAVFHEGEDKVTATSPRLAARYHRALEPESLGLGREAQPSLSLGLLLGCCGMSEACSAGAPHPLRGLFRLKPLCLAILSFREIPW